MIWGQETINVLSSDGSNGSTSYSSPGGKVSIVAPVTEAISVSAYSSIDTFYGVSVGGLFRIRFPIGGGFIRDPNLDTIAKKTNPAPSLQPLTNSSAPLVIHESHKIAFTPEGEKLGEVVKMNPQEHIAYIKEYLEGVSPLAEGNRVAQVAESNGALTTTTAAILGSQYLEVARLPVSQTVQQPFDINFFPTAPYVCASTPEGKVYGEQKLREENKTRLADEVAAADQVYLGPGNLVSSPSWQVWQSGSGDTISNGWPITTSSANAYRFSNAATCSKINSEIQNNRNYDGPQNPVRSVTAN
jgi:hypothetical protein